MKTASEERALIVQFLRMIAEEVPEAEAKHLNASPYCKAEIARLTTRRAADVIEEGMHEEYEAALKALDQDD